jgi:hypothetical protein
MIITHVAFYVVSLFKTTRVRFAQERKFTEFLEDDILTFYDYLIFFARLSKNF